MPKYTIDMSYEGKIWFLKRSLCLTVQVHSLITCRSSSWYSVLHMIHLVISSFARLHHNNARVLNNAFGIMNSLKKTKFWIWREALFPCVSFRLMDNIIHCDFPRSFRRKTAIISKEIVKNEVYMSTRSHISGINPMETLPLFSTYIIYFLMNISFVMLLAGMFNILYKNTNLCLITSEISLWRPSIRTSAWGKALYIFYNKMLESVDAINVISC